MVSIYDINSKNVSTSAHPDFFGRFGQFGGKYVPETLMPALSELETAFRQYYCDRGFQNELQQLMHDYVGRPSSLPILF